MDNKEKILVTGAGGFIGGWLAESLFLRGDTEVRAGIHNWSGAVRIARFPIDIALCDMLVPDQLMSAFNDMTCVIHCAKGSDESIIQGTRNVLDAAMKYGIKRFIHISTTEVYGNPSGNIDEAFPLQKTGNSYADAKIEAEKLCWEYHAKGLPVTIIRPPIVYGPFSKNWTMNVAFKLQSGNWGIYRNHGDGLCNVIYIADLVSGILLAARSESAVGETFNINGSETLSWNQYFQRFNVALGLPELRVIEPRGASVHAALLEPVRRFAKFAKEHFEIPIGRLAAKVGLAKKIMKNVENTIRTSPRATDLALYNRKAFYTAEKANNLFGFQPKISLDAGLDLTVRWMEQAGLKNS
jgi:nucleoside-diphosphate-sugar epimerase